MSQNHPARVFVVEDSRLIREALARIIKNHPDLSFAGEAARAEQAIQKIEEAQPDVIVMDVELPDGDGITLTQQIRSRFPNIRVIVHTTSTDFATFERSIHAKANGFCVKGATSDDIKNAIATVAKRGTWFCRGGSGKLHRSINPPQC